MKTFQEMAESFRAAIVSDTRTDGTTFYKLAEGSPEWMRAACREAHDGELPNDWRYDIIDSLLERIADDGEDDYDSGDAADGLVPIYNSDRVRWLGENVGRGDYCDRAAEEYGIEGGIFDRIGQGMYLCIQEMGHTLVEAIRTATEEQGDDE